MKYKNAGYNLKPYIVEIIIDRIETLKLDLHKDFDLELNNLIKLPLEPGINNKYRPIDVLEFFIKMNNQVTPSYYVSVTQHFIEYFAHHLKLKASDIMAMAEVSRKLDGYIDIEHYYKIYCPNKIEELYLKKFPPKKDK
jgi:hypothetical protein